MTNVIQRLSPFMLYFPHIITKVDTLNYALSCQALENETGYDHLYSFPNHKFAGDTEPTKSQMKLKKATSIRCPVNAYIAMALLSST
jgi:hypothetical protein